MVAVLPLLIILLLSLPSLRVWPVWRVWLLSSEQDSHLSARAFPPWQGEQGRFLLQAWGLMHGNKTLGLPQKACGMGGLGAGCWPSPPPGTNSWTPSVFTVWEGSNGNHHRPAPWLLRVWSHSMVLKGWFSFQAFFLLCTQIIIIKKQLQYKIEIPEPVAAHYYQGAKMFHEMCVGVCWGGVFCYPKVSITTSV